MINQAVILAAGKGTRMRPLTDHTPKPLLPLGRTTLLGWIMTGLKRAGVSRFIVVTGYLAEQIERYVADWAAAEGVHALCIDQGTPDGTGRAIHLCRDELDPDQPFFMTFGDIIVPHDHYRRMAALWHAAAPAALLSVNRVADPSQGAAVYLDEAVDSGGAGSLPRILRIIEKPPAGASLTNWNNSGIFVFQPVIFAHTARLRPSPRGEYEIVDAFMAMIAEGADYRAVPVEGFWSDVGTPAALDAMNRRLAELDQHL